MKNESTAKLWTLCRKKFRFNLSSYFKRRRNKASLVFLNVHILLSPWAIKLHRLKAYRGVWMERDQNTHVGHCSKEKQFFKVKSERKWEKLFHGHKIDSTVRMLATLILHTSRFYAFERKKKEKSGSVSTWTLLAWETFINWKSWSFDGKDSGSEKVPTSPTFRCD